MEKLEVGKSYYINYDGKVKLEAKVFDIRLEKGVQYVEWGITGAMILEPVEKFLEHMKAA